jgi:glyceraldehyde-3-phosphate dehydrogenase (NADP+)
MATTAPADIHTRIETMFPKLSEVPAEADFAPGGGLYQDGDQYLIDGEVRRWTGATDEVRSPICVENGSTERRLIGHVARLGKEEALAAMDAAVRAYDRGRGQWPTMTVAGRIDCMLHFCRLMQGVREECVRLLMWEIGKTRGDSEKEFDRTLQYAMDTVEELKELDRSGGRFTKRGGILAQIRRSPLGVVLCMGPFNYPINETFATLIPAIIMGNTVVVKLPRYGKLCQMPLLQCFAEAFPRGVVNVFNGAGREVVGPMFDTGQVASLAFIGSSKVAGNLKKQHPKPNRLRAILGLDAKNAAIVLGDADLDLAAKECITGGLSFNGQRCTAIKIIFVQRSIAEPFVQKLADAVDALQFGMPWEKGAFLTPLPEDGKAEQMNRYVCDALAGGARVVNKNGGLTNRTFFFPAVMYPIREGMELYTEEQFGPVMAVSTFDDVNEVLDYLALSDHGQQASVFGRSAAIVGPLVDILVNQVSRVNLNAQCQRGPDVFPFTGRKDSAEGTLSVHDALRSFSIRSMIAAPEGEMNKQLLRDILSGRTSNFINTDYIF